MEICIRKERLVISTNGLHYYPICSLSLGHGRMMAEVAVNNQINQEENVASWEPFNTVQYFRLQIIPIVYGRPWAEPDEILEKIMKVEIYSILVGRADPCS